MLHKTGLHLRPAGRIMETASRFKSNIKLIWKGRSANAKSLLEMVSLAILPGSELTFTAEGEDAEEAVRAIEELIRNTVNVTEDS